MQCNINPKKYVNVLYNYDLILFKVDYIVNLKKILSKTRGYYKEVYSNVRLYPAIAKKLISINSCKILL